MFAMTVPAAWSQEVRATLGGRVLDSTGAAVPNAQISLTSDDTGVTQHTVTNGDGVWVVQFLLPGHYRFEVKAPGFKKLERKGMSLQAADNKSVDVQLQVGAAEQTVEVTAEVPLIDTTSATSGVVIGGREILEMPSMSRVPTLLAAMAPGIVAQDQNNNPLHPWSYIGASQISGNGLHDNFNSNNYQLDGMPNTKRGGQISYVPTPDSLQEFRVQTNAYDAQIGRVSSVTINMQTKAGTSKYHGSLYEFNQNNMLNALQYGTHKDNQPPLHMNQYGGTFGGPVRIPKLYNGKDKTFFFINYEGLRNSNPKSAIMTVPTELERQGDFSKSWTISSGKQYPIAIYDPTRVSTKGARTQFTSDGTVNGIPNVIPKDRLNPIALNILKYIPLPNQAPDTTRGSSTNNFFSPGARIDKMAMISGRVDQNWSNAHRSFLVYRWMNTNETTENNFGDVATGKYVLRSPRSVGVDHVWTMSNNKVLDLRFSVNRYEDANIGTGAYENFDLTSLGFSKSFASQLSTRAFPYITGVVGNFGTAVNEHHINTYYTWSAGMTHMAGKHFLKYGGEYWILQQGDSSEGYKPRFDFSRDWTSKTANVSPGTGQGSAVASFLIGLPKGGQVNNNASGFYSQRFTGLYVQDDWRTTSKLTLNIGLRWDYERPITERYNRMVSDWDLTAVNPINAQARANYAANAAAAKAGDPVMGALLQYMPVDSFKVLGAPLFAGVKGQRNSANKADYHEFQPRFGFAYQIDSTTVIRGGIGRFTQSSFFTAGQLGFGQTTNFLASKDNSYTIYDSLSNPFQDGIQMPQGSSLGAMTNLGNGVNVYNQNPDRPYSWNSNLQIQKQYKTWLFEAAYVHSWTKNILVDKNINLTSFDTWKQLQTPTFDATGRPVDILLWGQPVANPFYNINGVLGDMGKNPTQDLNKLVKPYGLGSVTLKNNPIGSSVSDSLQVRVERRFSRGFSILNSFTWSKTFQDTDFFGPQEAGLGLDHRLGEDDRPFHLSIAPVWDLPFGRDRAFGKNLPKALDFVVGGWGVSGNFNIQSGTPVDFSEDQGFYNGKDFKLSGDKQSTKKWFDTSAFMAFPSKAYCLPGNPFCNSADIVTYPEWTGIQNMPGFKYYGTSADYKNGKCSNVCNGVYQNFANYVRNYPTTFGNIRNPRVNEVNLAMSKTFRVKEQVKLQYRFEAFNLFNHVRFGSPETNPGSGSFGQITETQQNSARQIQMALKLTF